MRKNILFVSPPQYGYQIDYFNYCKYLNEDFEITYICFDNDLDVVSDEMINIIYIKPDSNKFESKKRFIKEVIGLIKSKRFDICITYYFVGCLIIPFICKNKKIKFILDIRSGCVIPNRLKRNVINSLINLESFLFNRITIISEGLRKQLKIPKKRSFILPLGCDPIKTKIKDFHTSSFNLLYIGTFNNRDIQKTILGLSDYLQKFPNNKNNIKYTIIGTGYKEIVTDIERLISELGLSNIVCLKGYIKNTDLLSFYDNSNIGVSFVPITKYFDNQPPTKTFEYLQAGMPVIATNTKENRKVINKNNGVLVQDNYLEFSKKLSFIIENFTSYNSFVIRQTVEKNTWKKIVYDLNIFLKSI